MDVEFAPPRLHPVPPAAPGAPAAQRAQPVPRMDVTAPPPHPGITLVGPLASAGAQIASTRPTLRPIAGNDDEAVLYAAAGAGNTKVMSLLLASDPGPAAKCHALCHAVSAGKSAAVLFLLEHGANINERDAQTGATALHHAVSKANADMIELVLQRGADAALGDHAGNTPLHIAAMMNQLAILPLLLASAPTVRMANHEGNTPLMLAASQGHAEMTRRLASKSDLHQVNRNGNNALMLAAAGGHGDIVRRLLGKGASAGLFNRSGASAIQLAAEGGHLDVVLSLLASPGHVIDQGGSSRQSVLKIAAKLAEQRERGDIQADLRHDSIELWGLSSKLEAACNGARVVDAALLLACGAELECKTAHGDTPLITAAARGHDAICGLLLAKGADVNATDAEGCSVLMRALSGKDTSLALVQALIAKGANVGHQAKNHYSALDYAVMYGASIPIIALLSHGVNLNVKRACGDYLLPMAVKKGHLHVIEFVIEKGCDVNVYSNDWFELITPLMQAARNGHMEVVDLLLANGASLEVAGSTGFTALHLAVQGESTAMVKHLLKLGMNIDQFDHKGNTALSIACRFGATDHVKLLLEHGAKTHLTDEDGRTALLQTITAGTLDFDEPDNKRNRFIVVQQLLTYSASVNVVDGRGYTALTHAANRGDIDIVKLLLDHGAVNDCGNGTSNALDRAISGGHTEIANLLRARGARPGSQ